MSYIKREPLLQIAKELQGKVFGSPLIVKAIEEAPAEDVVRVVKCKDCKYHEDLDGGVKCKRIDGLLMIFPDDYCSYGRRTKE
jgi:hypothetical protein